MPLGPWRHIFASRGRVILQSCASSLSSRADCCTVSQGRFALSSSERLLGGRTERSSVGRTALPFRRFEEEASVLDAVDRLEWPFVTGVCLVYPINSRSPWLHRFSNVHRGTARRVTYLSPGAAMVTPSRSSKRRSWPPAGLLERVTEARSTSFGRCAASCSVGQAQTSDAEDKAPCLEET